MIGTVAGAGTLPLKSAPLAARAPGVALAVASMTTLQLGAALSEPLWDRLGPSGLVALRLALAALILWPFARPRASRALARGPRSRRRARRLLGRADRGVLRSDRPDPARCRGHDRVPRAARGRARRLAPCARRRLGAAGRRRRGAAHARRRGRRAARSRRDRVRRPLGGVLGRLHPPDEAGRGALGGARGTVDLARRRRARRAPARRVGRGLGAARARGDPRGGRAGAADPAAAVRVRADRAAPAAHGAVRRDHEPGAGDRRRCWAS